MYNDVVREGAADHDILPEDDQKLVGKTLNPITKAYLEAARDLALKETARV